MLRTIVVKLNERVVVFRHSIPVRALGPGSHTLWGFAWTEQRFGTDTLVFTALPEVRAVMPPEWFGEVRLDSHERAVLFQDGKPKVFLRPGVHRYWKVDDSVRLAIFDVREPMPPLTAEMAAILPRDEYVETTVREHERGLKYLQGRLVGTLAPGRYAFWSNPEARVDVVNVDMRTSQIALAAQELMTRDKVTLRLTLTLECATTDPALAATTVTSVKETLYLLVQLAARDYLASVTLDELLDGRDAMTRYLRDDVAPKAARFGVHVERAGVKDVVLPGEMKTLLNRVIEAEKEAAANVILRREETAATRSLANTAKVMAENPILLRLKELESLKEIASSVKEVRVLVGTDGIKSFLPAGLLTEPSRD